MITTKSNRKAAAKLEKHAHEECAKMLIPVRDALEVLRGKWKIPIIISLTHGTKRFKQIANDINGISDRMLSKELKDLEVNKLITRTVYDAFPPVVEYAITPHGNTLQKMICELKSWGDTHRKKIMEK